MVAVTAIRIIHGDIVTHTLLNSPPEVVLRKDFVRSEKCVDGIRESLGSFKSSPHSTPLLIDKDNFHAEPEAYIQDLPHRSSKLGSR